MLYRILIISTLLTVVLLFTSGCGRPVSYANDVFPILEKHCLKCHIEGGEGFAASGFRMETWEDFMRGTKYGTIVKPGSGFASTLMILIKHEADSSINMPVDGQALSEHEIKTIKVWIDEGARNN